MGAEESKPQRKISMDNSRIVRDLSNVSDDSSLCDLSSENSYHKNATNYETKRPTTSEDDLTENSDLSYELERKANIQVQNRSRQLKRSKRSTSNNYFKNLLSINHKSAFVIQNAYRRYCIRKAKIDTKKDKDGIILLFGASINSTITSTSDFNQCKQMLELSDLPLEIKDLGINSGYLHEAEQYGRSQDLPFVIINGINIGGLHELINIVDLKILRAIFNKEYINRCLLCNATRINESADYCSNCFKELLWFAKAPYKATEIIGKAPKPPSENESDLGDYKENDFLSFYEDSNKLNKTEIITKKPSNNKALANIENNDMVIGGNLLSEFMNADHSFDSGTDETSSVA
ncbi:unnamed protein product [Moneuplotes crassus]|uniref:Uncharacterized protein n=1 Tax=Euplotes crassus TaxID=5936 RepID=A0AAD1UPN3_EUPCR|nr:unnamed protein product [Moneuplotes crassus]